MDDYFAQVIDQHGGTDLPQEQQMALGTPRKDDMSDEHDEFLQLVLTMIDENKISTQRPQSFIKSDVYEELSQEWKGKVDMAVPNLVSLLERIMDLHARSEENESFEMKNLIETLWQAKQRIEIHADVFIF